MANPEHVEIVKAGADAIADWRKKNPEVTLDLEGAHIMRVDLWLADLRGANLARVEMEQSDLRDANLAGADFSGANLAASDLTFARLDGANLQRADLRFANLTSTTVSDVDFEGAVFSFTVLGGVDLSEASGLESVFHEMPSVIDEQTLRRSWPLPDVLLRGVGMSEEWIDFARATYGKAIQFYSCFISYSSKADEFAKRLHADLQAEGVRCWFAPEDLRIGDKFRVRIDEAIRLHDKLLLILSEDSVNSTWVEDEVENAFGKERKAKKDGTERTVLFPIRLDSAVEDTNAAWASAIQRTRHIGDFSAWKDHDAYQEAFQRLLRDLKSE